MRRALRVVLEERALRGNWAEAGSVAAIGPRALALEPPEHDPGA